MLEPLELFDRLLRHLQLVLNLALCLLDVRTILLLSLQTVAHLQQTTAQTLSYHMRSA